MQNPELIRSKILDLPALKRQIATWRFFRKKIVFTNGCFDIIHLGHIDYLYQAKKLGDKLLIGLNTDESVRQIKGPGRPVVNQDSRAFLLASIGFIDGVVLFNETTPYDLIGLIVPHILVKGSDYQIENIVGADIVKNNGGKIETLPFLDGYSTTSIIQKIRNLPV